MSRIWKKQLESAFGKTRIALSFQQRVILGPGKRNIYIGLRRMEEGV